MFKGKIWIWIILILVSAGIKFYPSISNNISEKLKREESLIYIDTNDSRIINSFYTNNKIKKVKFSVVQSLNNANTIISKHSDNDFDEYMKYSNELFSPMVIYVSENVKSDKSEMTILKNSACSEVYIKDYKTIFELLENGNNSFENLNFKALNGKFNIVVPAKNSAYYEETIKLMLISLYDTPTTDKNVFERMTRVNALYDKCIQVEDVLSYGKTNENTSDFLIGPELYYIQSSRFRNNSSYKNFIPIYGKKTYIVYYDLYIKKDQEDLANYFINSIRTKERFHNNIGFRNSYAKYAVKNLTYNNYLIESANIKNENDLIKTNIFEIETKTQKEDIEINSVENKKENNIINENNNIEEESNENIIKQKSNTSENGLSSLSYICITWGVLLIAMIVVSFSAEMFW